MLLFNDCLSKKSLKYKIIMCGILACLFNGNANDENQKFEELQNLLRNRGPDIANHATIKVSDRWHITFSGFTLWLQGSALTCQPLVDKSGNTLLWNGDAFYNQVSQQEIPEGKSDSQFLLEQLEVTSTIEEICSIIESVQGPWAVIYFKKSLNQIVTGRDKFGRHSLLWNLKDFGEHAGCLVISSVAPSRQFKELEAYHLYTISLSTDSINIQPCHSRQKYSINKQISAPIDVISNITCPEKVLSEYLSAREQKVTSLKNLLISAIKTRVECQPKLCKTCVKQHLEEGVLEKCEHAKVAVLFSGGLDSTVLAALTDAVWPSDETIDLLNVAFPLRASSKEDEFNVPDRLTGLQALEELKKLNPNRNWNFVQVNVSLEELQEKRNVRIATLINPASTVLDDSIGCAQWFAASGDGYLLGSDTEKYVSPARVILMGAGADEQMGGYARHRKRFAEGGWTSLINEIEMEVNRISERNLGRDNRIIADHGRAPRLPYLDEKVVDYLAALPIDVKVDLRNPIGIGDKIILRSLAFSLGLTRTATEPKRAIQFGSRIAKTEAKKEKGSFICERLTKAQLID